VPTLGRAGTVAAAAHPAQAALAHEPHDALARDSFPALPQGRQESRSPVGPATLRVDGFEFDDQPGILARAHRGLGRTPAVVPAA